MAVHGLGLLALMRGIPTLQPLLQPVGGGLRRHGAEQHTLTHLGQLIPQLGGAAREDLGGDPDGRVTLISPLHHLFGRRVGGLEEVVGEGEEPRQRIGIELGKLEVVSHCRKVMAASLFLLAGFIPMPMSV